MYVPPARPGRRAVLRAGSASIVALAAGLFLTGRPATAEVPAPSELPHEGTAPGHRHLIGVL
ncbi:hypothetical protein [Pseudarthrobacter phenanthrenivorans]|uniref:hypothetical protein n=1 Tax=Pseudarthrobacter phenanthrenivorans TaxID=361575 RepID=UPI0015E85D02|nr:hypothetical protein [Pseudarthrobacter phenanthrenivorans]